MTKTSKPFMAQFDSDCGDGDRINEGDEIVMWDGEAWLVECAEEAGAKIPGVSDDDDNDDELRDPYE